MHKNDNNNQDFIDKAKTPSEIKAEDIKFWRNEHGHPSFEYLRSLADDDSPGAMEKLKSIATDLNVRYGPNTPVEVLIERIRAAALNNPNTTT